jgi:hypothetical protein
MSLPGDHQTWLEWIETTARIADMLSYPTEEELQDLGVDNMPAYWQALADGTIQPLERRPSAQWNMPKTRPLSWKFEKTIELYFHVAMQKVRPSDSLQQQRGVLVFVLFRHCAECVFWFGRVVGCFAQLKCEDVAELEKKLDKVVNSALGDDNQSL